MLKTLVKHVSVIQGFIETSSCLVAISSGFIEDRMVFGSFSMTFC